MEAGFITIDLGIIIGAVLVVASIVLLLKGVLIIQQSECVIVERLGSYHRTLKSGLNIIVPIIDKPRRIFWLVNGGVYPTSRIDLREAVLDVDKQAVITRDNVAIDIDALLYIQVVDPTKAAYEVANVPVAVSQLTQTSLRNVIGEMDLDHTLASRDIINAKLKTILDEATDKWGTKVNRVELKNIAPPRDIQIAMEKQMQAERERRAIVLAAEGEKQARIARSEGMRQEQINIAEGEKEAQIRRAEGTSSAIQKIADARNEALEKINATLGNPQITTQFLVALNYIEEFGKFMQKPGDKVYVPFESSAALGSLGAVKDLFLKK